MLRRHHEDMPQRADRARHQMRQLRRLARRADYEVGAAHDQCIPRSAEHLARNAQARLHLQIVERMD